MTELIKLAKLVGVMHEATDSEHLVIKSISY